MEIRHPIPRGWPRLKRTSPEPVHIDSRQITFGRSKSYHGSILPQPHDPKSTTWICSGRNGILALISTVGRTINGARHPSPSRSRRRRAAHNHGGAIVIVA
jgi:hypothetical protein